MVVECVIICAVSSLCPFVPDDSYECVCSPYPNDISAHGVGLNNLCRKCIHPCMALRDSK